MTQLTKLLQPLKVGSLELKNRLVMLGLHLGFAEKGRPTSRLIDFYVERARGGVGLIITGITLPVSLGHPNLEMADNEAIGPYRNFTQAVHAHGAKVALQLGLQYHWRRGPDSPVEAVAPSAVVTRPDVKPRPLTREEIHQIVTQLGEAARRAREAGFDAVEFHAGIGYLINRFLSPATNQRDDEYGGSLESRLRFLLEIVASAQARAGKDFTYLCRLSAEEFMAGGHTLADTLKMLPYLEKAGLHALDVQAGWHEAPVPLVQASVAPGAFAYLAKEVKKATPLPVVVAYRINDPLLAERLLAEGTADLVGMGRALIADPELPRKAQEGRLAEIRPCIACCRCLDRILMDIPLDCSVNPRAGREGNLAPPATSPKKVIIIGGGPAGMEAAIVTRQRGHEVTLVEKGNRLGGNLLWASVPPFKEDIAKFTDYLASQVAKAGVKVELGQKATPELMRKAKPVFVLLATGATALLPNIGGVAGSNVVTALDVLSGKVPTGERVLVIGGGMIGCETAEFLAAQGKKVTVVEMLERLGSDIGRTTRWTTLQRLRKAGVEAKTGTKAVEITPAGVKALAKGQEVFLEGDTVVLAVGLKPEVALASELQKEGIPFQSIGDCREPRRIAEAIHEGYEAAQGL